MKITSRKETPKVTWNDVLVKAYREANNTRRPRNVQQFEGEHILFHIEPGIEIFAPICETSAKLSHFAQALDTARQVVETEVQKRKVEREAAFSSEYLIPLKVKGGSGVVTIKNAEGHVLFRVGGE